MNKNKRLLYKVASIGAFIGFCCGLSLAMFFVGVS